MNAPFLVTNPTVTSQPILPTSNNSHPLFVPSRCKAKDRLILWTPVKLHAMNITDLLSPSDIKHVYKVIAQAWADSTKEIYDFKQLAFHIFCNNKNIPQLNCAPANPVIICSFISTLVGPCMGSKQICYILILYFNFAGSYSDSMVSNYLNRVRTWHVIHGVKWALNDQKIKALLKAAFLMALPQSKWLSHEPYTIEIITIILNTLNLNSPLHAAIVACLTTAFYATTWTSKLTIKNLQSFNPKIHIKPSDVSRKHDWQGNTITNFHLLKTKMAPDGKHINWAKQESPSDPHKALQNHLMVNNPPCNSPLFTYCNGKTHKLLTKTKFLDTLPFTLKQSWSEPSQWAWNPHWLHPRVFTTQHPLRHG